MDLNADVGESFGPWSMGDDDTLLSLVTSANVACGFHAGDPRTLRRTTERAAAFGVAIGAQVSYRDLVGFGRRFMDIRPLELRDDIVYQIGALDAFARLSGRTVSYVKPHGALYHAVVQHEEQAQAVVEAVTSLARTTRRELALLGQPGSALLTAAEKAGLRTVREAFADRGYDTSGQLLPRDAPGALVTDLTAVAERAVRMAVKGEVVTDDGSVVLVATESICVHGDTPGAVEIARSVRTALEGAGVELASFADR
jgi:5-oxoprolinase (ATP-hydrolysing) subunit A